MGSRLRQRRRSAVAVIELVGTLVKADAPAWGYGTHLMEVNHEVFALASEDVHLEEYVGQKVKVLGEAVKSDPRWGTAPFT